MNLLIDSIITFLCGERVNGEPANYPQSGPREVRDRDGDFFEWCQEYNVGCRAKNIGVFY